MASAPDRWSTAQRREHVFQTTLEPRVCNACGKQAAIGAGVARPVWWCLTCLPAQPFAAVPLP